MNILVLNGSPRKNSNTLYALSTIVQGITENTSNTVEMITVTDMKISGCIACDMCQKNGGDCIQPDDTKVLIEKIVAADMLIFGTPVYWWGVSSQLKAVIDKFYPKTEVFQAQEQKKKFALVAVGADTVPSTQYQLINDQFTCIGDFLGWEKVFDCAFSALAAGELEKSEEAKTQLAEMWKKI